MLSPNGTIAAIIFDFDGVLADTERLHLTAFQQVFSQRGWQLDERAYFARYLGYDDEGLVAAFADDERLGLSATERGALVTEKGDVFSSLLEAGSVLFPGAKTCIERLAGQFALGIASGALRSEITGILGAAGLLRAFPVIVSAEDVTDCKPAPEPYVTAARLLGVRPAACVAVEDSPPGLQSARAAGMSTIGITTTVSRHLLPADVVVDRLDELSLELVHALGPPRGL